jgi:hypothetical protein
MKDHRPPSVILVELDALLDTRLPTLSLISSKAGLECAQDPRYYDRVIDDFEPICGITKDAFRALYQKRDAEIMRSATITEMPFILNDLVSKLELETLDTPFVSRVIVEVNIYPYTLDEEERDLIALAVMARCGGGTEVRCVRFAANVLTPAVVRERYSGLILYNFRDWMQCHLEAFISVKMPRVSVLAPALYHDVVPADNVFVEDGIAGHITAFQLSEVGCVELFALSLLPAVNFSMARIPGHYTPKPMPVAERVEIEVPTDFTVK